jgi:hypothetical protein
MKLTTNIKNNEANITNNKELIEFLFNNTLTITRNINPPVSFYQDNTPISYFNENTWSLSDTKDQSEFCILDFNNYMKLNLTFMLEFKYLTLMTYLENRRKYSNIKEIKRIASCLYPLMIASQSLGHESFSEISNNISFYSVMNKIKGHYTFRTLENILNTLKASSRINSSYFKLGINLSEQSNNVKSEFNSKDLAIKYSKTQSDHVDQTLYIPNKIHSKLISTCINFIKEKKVNLTNIMSLLEEDYLVYEKIKKDLDIINLRKTSKVYNRKSKITTTLFEKYNLTQFKDTNEIQKEIRLLSTACVILMLNFSGMRINELCNIQVDGFKIVNTEPKLYILRSYETKISGGQIADYITSPIVKDCVDILAEIHAFARKYDNTINSTDLFVISKHQKLLTYGSISSLPKHIREFSNEINLLLDSNDIKESELLNGPREDIKIGKIWPLASHQFRRTLVVNFVSHRLGTINSVKQQLKHMYSTMTEYYAKNSRLAETFNLKVVKEISDLIEEELLNEGVRQYKDFYYSKEPLAGIKGQEIMNERESIKVLSDEEIKQLFKTGLYKISKSMYGYCTKGNLCDKKEAIDPTFCGASCSTMIITKENANNWQKLYFRNHKLLNSEKELSIGGIPMNGVKTTMQSQNEVAKKIMDQFNMKYED